MNKKFNQIQLVFYSPGIIITDKAKVANSINEILMGLFNGDPVMLAIPEEAPLEIPRIQLQSNDKKYSLSIAKNRADFIFRAKTEEEQANFPASGLFEKFLTIFRYFNETINTQITRSAIVVSFITELEKTSSAEYILLKYLKNEVPIYKPHELELHYLLKDSIAGLEVNKWTRIKSSRLTSEPEKNWFIVFHLDINTLAEIEYRFDKDLLERFINEGSESIKDTIGKHFKIIEE